jgi:predicted O-methyltransferase YrrM
VPPQGAAQPALDATAGARYADVFAAEDGPLALARARAAELGAPAVTPSTGAMLQLLATVISARHVVEIGTGTGVSGLWLLAGMRPDGILTSIDVEAEQQRHARQAFAAAGHRPNRVRLIGGRPLEVLPRLTDAAYDLVLVNADPQDSRAYLSQALRLLRVGGLVVFTSVLGDGRLVDPSARDPDTLARRELVELVRDDESLLPALLPLGGGVLAAVKQST